MGLMERSGKRLTQVTLLRLHFSCFTFLMKRKTRRFGMIFVESRCSGKNGASGLVGFLGKNDPIAHHERGIDDVSTAV
jgi:hypothetical protein